MLLLHIFLSRFRALYLPFHIHLSTGLISNIPQPTAGCCAQNNCGQHTLFAPSRPRHQFLLLWNFNPVQFLQPKCLRKFHCRLLHCYCFLACLVRWSGEYGDTSVGWFSVQIYRNLQQHKRKKSEVWRSKVGSLDLKIWATYTIARIYSMLRKEQQVFTSTWLPSTRPLCLANYTLLAGGSCHSLDMVRPVIFFSMANFDSPTPELTAVPITSRCARVTMWSHTHNSNESAPTQNLTVPQRQTLVLFLVVLLLFHVSFKIYTCPLVK